MGGLARNGLKKTDGLKKCSLTHTLYLHTYIYIYIYIYIYREMYAPV
jgi:hypothetical protein